MRLAAQRIGFAFNDEDPPFEHHDPIRFIAPQSVAVVKFVVGARPEELAAGEAIYQQIERDCVHDVRAVLAELVPTGEKRLFEHVQRRAQRLSCNGQHVLIAGTQERTLGEWARVQRRAVGVFLEFAGRDAEPLEDGGRPPGDQRRREL